MDRHLAFVFGGGGARGALQVGAVRALLEAGFRPDLIVGTSIGAVNAVSLAMHGVNASGVEALERDWHDAISANLMPANRVWLALRLLFHRGGGVSYNRMRSFFMAHGLTPSLRFCDLPEVRLILVAADLNTGRPVLYGVSSDDSVLEGVLASTALPPWGKLLEKDGQLLIDGGLVSNLPVETALSQGATHIVALDLADSRDSAPDVRGFGPLVGRLVAAVEQRQIELELHTAEAHAVPVQHIALCGETPVAIWDFPRAAELIPRGYELVRQEIAAWPAEWRALAVGA